MKILIVNGYSKTSAGIQNFSDFQYFIQKVLKEQKEMVDTETEFFVRDKENLDDFLYELDSSYVKKDAAKLFDYLDMIFITGDANLLPWNRSISKILILLRMCLRVKKFLFASSFAMQCLIFLSASNLEKNITIVNGQGKGGKIGDFRSLDKDIKELKQTDYFLDNITGDLYSYNYENEEWIAKANAGLHFQKAAQEFHSIGKFIIQAPVYRPKSVTDSAKNIYVSRNTEIIGYLKKIHLHHWAVQDMSYEFLVPFKNSWYVHSFAFMNKSKKFDILSECEKGPLIVEFKNILATQFEIDPKYPETSIPLKNFIHFHLRLIKTYNKSSESLILTFYNATKNIEILHQLEESAKQKRHNNRTFKFMEENNSEKSNKFTHAGLAMKRHGNSFLVDQNMVDDKVFKMKKNMSPEKKTVRLKEDYEEKPKNSRPFSQYNTTKHTDGKGFFYENDKIDQIFNEFDDKEGKENTFKKAEVRNLLHPNLAKELLNEEDLWVPGKYSEFKKLYENRKVIRLKSANFLSQTNSKIKTTMASSKTNIRHNMMNKELFYPMSPINPKTPFIEWDKQKRYEDKVQAEKNIGPKFTMKRPLKLISSKGFLFEEEMKYTPISNHQFRDESKQRWIEGKGFRF